MKRFLRWIGKTIGSAITIVLVLVMFPHISRLAARLMPDESGAAIKTSVILHSKLENSARLETLKVQEDGVLNYDIQAAFLGSVANINISYQYNASFGIDLSKVTMQVTGNTITFCLPPAEVLQDSLDPQEIYRDDFWYPGFSDQDYENLLEKERTARRNVYLSGESEQTLWNATVAAFEQTVSAWIAESHGSPDVQFEYIKSTEGTVSPAN